MTAALEGGEWSAARPGRTLPPGKTRYPLYRRLDGPQSRSGRAENIVPTGIRSRTVQPVVSRYTDWAIRATWNASVLDEITDLDPFSVRQHTRHKKHLKGYKTSECEITRWYCETDTFLVNNTNGQENEWLTKESVRYLVLTAMFLKKQVFRSVTHCRFLQYTVTDVSEDRGTFAFAIKQPEWATILLHARNCLLESSTKEFVNHTACY